MKLKEEATAPDVRVEIIPLIDVIFCILTFFILASLSLTRQQAINVDLPRASTGVSQMREMLLVSIDPFGQTYIDQQPVTADQLYQELLSYQETNPNGLMVLYASRSATYSRVVEVLDLLRSVGGDRVALATLPNTGEAADPNAIPGLDGQGVPIDPTAPGFGVPGSGLPGSDFPGSGLPGSELPSSPNSFDPNQTLFPSPQPLPGAGSGLAPTPTPKPLPGRSPSPDTTQ